MLSSFAYCCMAASALLLCSKAVSATSTPQPNYSGKIPDTIEGRVFTDGNRNGVLDKTEKGVAGVSVSDGYSVVSTDKQGRYCLVPSDKAVFVYVTRPSGHDIVGPWYKPISAQADFALVKSERDETKFTFIQVTDTHVSTDPTSLRGLKRFVQEINNLRSPPLFVFNTGDLIQCSKNLTTPVHMARSYFDNYTRIMNELNMPYYNVAGDHTDVGYRMERYGPGNILCGKAMYWEYLGPHFFSFEYGKLHFVSVDTAYHFEAKLSNTLVPEHLAWLRRDLEKRIPGTAVVTGSEHPLDPWIGLDLIPDFASFASAHAVKLQLYGDDHVVHYNEAPVPSRCGGALSGTWWAGKCCDLSPQGYMIYQANGQDLDCFYKGLGEDVCVTAPEFGSAVKGLVSVHAHLVQGKSKGPLEYSLDGREWRAMEEKEPSFYRKQFLARVDTTALPDGPVKLLVRARDTREVRESVLVVDNGRDTFTAHEGAKLKLKVAKVGWADKPSKRINAVFNGKIVGILQDRKAYDIPIPAEDLRRVNHLAFSLPDSGMGMAVPVLEYTGKIVHDPRQLEIRKIRLNCWLKSEVPYSGVLVGRGRGHSLAVSQNEFLFVLPDP